MDKLVVLLSSYIVFASQILAMFVISVGMTKALLTFIKDALLGKESAKAIYESRMELGHSFSLGLGFLIGASILKTTIAPSWNDIGLLSSIIVIRTILNYFLTREISNLSTKSEAETADKAVENKEEK